MKFLVARPVEYRLFGTSTSWKLSEKMVPKTLEGENFEGLALKTKWIQCIIGCPHDFGQLAWLFSLGRWIPILLW